MSLAIRLASFAIALAASPPLIAGASEAIPPLAPAADAPRGFALTSPARAGFALRLDAAAFALQEGESLHPGLPARDLAVELVGDVDCASAGDYAFLLDCEGGAAALSAAPLGCGSGGLSPTVSGRRPAPGERAQLQASVTVAQPGRVRVRVTFARRDAERAALRLDWQLSKAGAASFAREPLPSRAVAPPAEHESAWRNEERAAAGRQLLGERCVQCHAPEAAANAFAPRAKLDLSQVAARADGEWLARWIADPSALKRGVAMPALLPAEPREAAASAADLVAFLQSTAFGGESPAHVAEAVDAAQARRGRELFHTVGCVACHGPREAPATVFGDESFAREVPAGVAPVALGELRGKWRLAPLAAYLRDPAAARPGSAMPSLALDEGEAQALAHYVVQQFGGAPARESALLDVAAVARGKARFTALGCANCHEVASGGEGSGVSGGLVEAAVVSGGPPLAKLDARRGCLAEEAASAGRAPRHALDGETRATLRAGLQSLAAIATAGAPSAPLERGRAAFAEQHCAACHEQHGRGGPGAWGVYFRSRVEADLGDEGRMAPRLDGVGGKLASPWLARVVGEGARARPYVATRMPRFGAPLGEAFATSLAAAEGEWRSDATSNAGSDTDLRVTVGGPSAEQRALDGRKLAGSGGMNCVTCHSFGDRPSAGTPGLDFTQFATRLRRRWWERYALAPARFKPGTRMPRYFEEGASTVALLDGDPARQTDALWHWFERAGAMPAPEGVPTGERRVLAVGDRPVVFRTFLARAGNRGIAIGTPSGLHFAFDAEQIRLCEAWRGDFLDVAPVWEGRGGGVAVQLGEVVWSAAAGPLLLLEKPGGGQPWPWDSGRAHGVKFLGYRIEPDGTPVFEWELRGGNAPFDAPPSGEAVKVEERFLPDPRPDVLFVRKVVITVPRDGLALWVQPQGPRARLLIGGMKPPAGVEPLIVTPSASSPLELLIEVR
ncbi:MAG: c-type cytochrome [Planctomycetes bacterium]|nr:c-type cytochrome [Planctomycetota bacterium]